MDAHRTPSEAEVIAQLRDRRNWGRWGDNDQRGAINLIDDRKRALAAACVRTGQALTLSMPLNPESGPDNPEPVSYSLGTDSWGDSGAGFAHDRIEIGCHNRNVTHLDALCHIWDSDGMWGGRRPDEVLTEAGSAWADIDNWGDGIVTRGVLLDIPGLRGTDHVPVGQPVHGWELDEAARQAGITLEAGDAVCVFSGRQSWERQTRADWTVYPPDPRPGLHASSLRFMRDHDVAVLAWDLIDARPPEYAVPWPVHGALLSYGLALVDHAWLEPLATACRDSGQYTFMFVVAPLRIPGGTGSPVNPIAVL